jgi:hypothetical protein
LKYFSDKLVRTLNQKELLKLSRIVIIEPDDPSLSAIQEAMHVEHGLVEIKDRYCFLCQAKHWLTRLKAISSQEFMKGS